MNQTIPVLVPRGNRNIIIEIPRDLTVLYQGNKRFPNKNEDS